MRRFVFVSHTAPSVGGWSLDDLPGFGRADVLCRNVQAALCLSHGLRPDVEVYIQFLEPRARVLRIEGGSVRRLYPDERSTGARLAKALATPGSGPAWKEVDEGLSVADLDLEDLLDEVPGVPVLLDPDGEAVEGVVWPDEPTMVLSDHVPFTLEEYRSLDRRDAARVSLGPAWYHANHVVSVLHHMLDRQRRAPEAR